MMPTIFAQIGIFGIALVAIAAGLWLTGAGVIIILGIFKVMP